MNMNDSIHTVTIAITTCSMISLDHFQSDFLNEKRLTANQCGRIYCYNYSYLYSYHFRCEQLLFLVQLCHFLTLLKVQQAYVARSLFDETEKKCIIKIYFRFHSLSQKILGRGQKGVILKPKQGGHFPILMG